MRAKGSVIARVHASSPPESFLPDQIFSSHNANSTRPRAVAEEWWQACSKAPIFTCQAPEYFQLSGSTGVSPASMPRARVLHRWRGQRLHVQGSCGPQGPVRIAQEFTREHHEIGLPVAY